MIFVVFIVMILHHKGFIDIESIGIPENYLYYGGLALILLGIAPLFLVWRCPGCGAHLGKKPSPEKCDNCGAIFRE
jgi:rubrerythrin